MMIVIYLHKRYTYLNITVERRRKQGIKISTRQVLYCIIFVFTVGSKFCYIYRKKCILRDDLNENPTSNFYKVG